MTKLENLSQKYLYTGSPFLYEITDVARRVIQSKVTPQQPLAQFAVVYLKEMCIRHVDYLKTNLWLCSQFDTSLTDLETYKFGFFTPLAMIQISTLRLMGVIVSYGFDDRLESFIKSKKDSCTDLMNQKAPWEKIFRLACEYNDTSDYFYVGVLAAEKAFVKIVGS